MAQAKIDDNREKTIIGVSSVDGETPTLVKVNPSTGAIKTEVTGAGFRFASVSVPAGATIDVAYVSLFHHTSGDTIGNDIDCEDADDPGTFTTTANDISDRTLTGNAVAWSGTTGDSQFEDTPSIVTPVQAVIDRAGWSSGNAINVILNDTKGTNENHRIRTYDNLSTEAAKLHIEYTEGGGDTAVKDIIGSGIIPFGR